MNPIKNFSSLGKYFSIYAPMSVVRESAKLVKFDVTLLSKACPSVYAFLNKSGSTESIEAEVVVGIVYFNFCLANLARCV